MKNRGFPAAPSARSTACRAGPRFPGARSGPRLPRSRGGLGWEGQERRPARRLGARRGGARGGSSGPGLGGARWERPSRARLGRAGAEHAAAESRTAPRSRPTGSRGASAAPPACANRRTTTTAHSRPRKGEGSPAAKEMPAAPSPRGPALLPAGPRALQGLG